MTQYLKGDCVNNAYQELRISGLTSIPGPNELKTGLRMLEGMAREYFKVNICVGYNFEDTPDANSSAGIPVEYQIPFELCLATRLVSIFGKGAQDKIDPVLFQRRDGAFSFLSGSTAIVQRMQPSRRNPIGSGNERRSWHLNRFYKPVPEAPPECATNRMIVGDIDNFREHFDSYLIDSEVIASYTIESNTGLTIVSDSLATPDVLYQIEAVGANTDNSGGLYQVKIVATTDSGRVTTRLINFELEEIKIA